MTSAAKAMSSTQAQSDGAEHLDGGTALLAHGSHRRLDPNVEGVGHGGQGLLDLGERHHEGAYVGGASALVSE